MTKIEFIDNATKSILSGFMIGFGAIVNLICISKGNPLMGAIFFSMGLFAVCSFGLNLYTGKIGYLAENLTWKFLLNDCLFVFLFNAIGIGFFAWISGLCYEDLNSTICTISHELISQKIEYFKFFPSILCGALMYMAVYFYKTRTIFAPFIFVSVFVYCGFDHSVANIFYPIAGAFVGDIDWVMSSLFIMYNILGNAVGALVISLSQRFLFKKQ